MPTKKIIKTQLTSRRRRPKKSRQKFWIYMLICVLIVLVAQIKPPRLLPEDTVPGTISEVDVSGQEESSDDLPSDLSYEDLPEYNGQLYTEINGNIPDFTGDDEELLSQAGYEYYSSLDGLGRCGYAEACVGQETMPEGEERGDIYTVHPSGWRSGQGWERCHLIAWSLTGENANDHNLVTGTHQFNVDGMLPFEIEIAEAADKGLHIMYRVTPVYNGAELIPRGVHMVARTVEDESVSFNVFVYNVEDGKTIDYYTGYIY